MAVRLIVEREREIEAFKTEEYWKVTAELAPTGTIKDRSPVKAKLRKKAEGEEETAGLEQHPGTFLAVPAIVLAAAVAGAYVPVLRATRLAPTAALRADA